MTLRALRVLREVDLIASEDPVATHLLLSHHGIEATVTSYGPANLKEKVAVLIHRLRRGAQVAIVSDCGSPVISDPGCLLVAAAHSHGIQVMSVPGPSALPAAVAVTGLSGDSFFFQGRLPETKTAVKRCLARALKNPETTVIFCTSESLRIAVDRMAQVAPRRSIVLVCDMTRPEETIVRGTPRQIQKLLDKLPAAQDVTIIITGRSMSKKRKVPRRNARKLN